jgi:hypothetical protein
MNPFRIARMHVRYSADVDPWATTYEATAGGLRFQDTERKDDSLIPHLQSWSKRQLHRTAHTTWLPFA